MLNKKIDLFPRIRLLMKDYKIWILLIILLLGAFFSSLLNNFNVYSNFWNNVIRALNGTNIYMVVIIISFLIFYIFRYHNDNVFVLHRYFNLKKTCLYIIKDINKIVSFYFVIYILAVIFFSFYNSFDNFSIINHYFYDIPNIVYLIFHIIRSYIIIILMSDILVLSYALIKFLFYFINGLNILISIYDRGENFIYSNSVINYLLIDRYFINTNFGSFSFELLCSIGFISLLSFALLTIYLFINIYSRKEES